MDLRIRLILFLVISGVLVVTGFEVTRTLQPKPPSRESIGLEWLRQEYQLTDEAHERIIRLHREYFSRCDAMCAEMIAAHRPSKLRGRAKSPVPSAEESLQREKVICERCLNSMIGHLREVSSLMTPEHAQRFLADILPEVSQVPELETIKSKLSSGVQ